MVILAQNHNFLPQICFRMHDLLVNKMREGLNFMFYFDYEIDIQSFTDVPPKSCYNLEPATLLKRDSCAGAFL